MNIKVDLNLKQTQKLVMTTEMKQAIEILQLTSMELNNLIDKELLENPMLEFNDSPMESMEVVKDEAAKKEESKDQIEWDDYFQNMQSTEFRNTPSSSYDPDDEFNFEKFSYYETTLNEYLLLQFHVLSEDLTETENLIGEYLIDCIDDNGYLLIDMDYICDILGVTQDVVEKLIGIIQQFDPAGVGARDIKECLLIQLRQEGYDDEVYENLVNNYLTDLAENQFKRVSQETGISTSELAVFKELIKTLEPKPGRQFTNFDGVKYIIPDGSIEWIDNELVVQINDISAPRLQINSFYQGMLKTRNENEDTKKYIEKKLDSAAFLIKSIEQRRDTIRKVIEAIAHYQENFFREGVEDLKPLTLKAIADMIEVHESTVSRAIRGKYVQTPKGTFSLKFFFKRGFSQGADDVSSEAIKQKIQAFVDAEDKRKPLSDQKIVEMLKEQGVDVARRTIAKYREALNILPSSKRKQFR
ncbi:RNA polymerase factor sigma-54 [Eubacterium maltosivorans]|uniref:RNA polymerase sigma-54 factor n=1 Tax=Eubacterium maltosivorans TaxID=2041044 RepID=A0A4P9CBF0_EUBML|nr:RNA polymerase factor sigma-54 [Eubacterium maltosivorans]QCT72833.1 RNA polymerase sigma-54 factor [Eubacterium maltosivorans]